MNKSELRKWVREQKSKYTREELDDFSRHICNEVMSDGLWRAAHTVLLYHALPDEVDTQMLIDNALYTGKQVLLPKVVGDVLELRIYNGELQLGAFGIQESVGPVFTAFEKIDLSIIPGMAFDAYGNRLGRGKGYYDRLLPLIHTPKIGICFPFQRVEHVPVEEHDVKVMVM